MSNDEECNCAQSLRLKKEVEELQERFMRLRRDVIEIVLWEKKGIAEATTVEPVERRNGRPHVHRADRAIDDWHDVCLCGATRRWARDHTMRAVPLAWVEPVAAAPAADESEPPEGWAVSEPPEGWAVRMGSKLAGGWWRKNQYGDERWYESRAAAVAACWAAHRAQQPATVTAPEPTLEAQLAEAMKKREELWYAYRRSPGVSCASQSAKDAYRDALDRTHELTEAIAARDGKAGT